MVSWEMTLRLGGSRGDRRRRCGAAVGTPGRWRLVLGLLVRTVLEAPSVVGGIVFGEWTIGSPSEVASGAVGGTIGGSIFGWLFRVTR
jgi:hypothetical protein